MANSEDMQAASIQVAILAAVVVVKVIWDVDPTTEPDKEETDQKNFIDQGKLNQF